ncbi:MAG: class I SAM-dependent methyltransferase [Bacteroidales bacterium]|nr:class I SAM-dependent methyltransferase [Bacteroidales bacterium]
MKINFREWLFRIWYWYVSNIDKNAEVLFMNYGYSSADQNIDLDEKDEPNRYSIQLYHHLAAAVDIQNKSLLEIGSGRGGGLSFVARNFPVKEALGVDLNERAAKFCNKYYKISGLKFMQGDAQNLDIEDNSFDTILNVESSHRYPDMKAFLSEVKRILKPGGHFLFTDFRYDYEMEELNNYLNETGFIKIREELITPKVVKALDLDDERRRKLVKKLAPGFLQKIALNFAGAKGSETYNYFAERKYEYFSYVFQKQ